MLYIIVFDCIFVNPVKYCYGQLPTESSVYDHIISSYVYLNWTCISPYLLSVFELIITKNKTNWTYLLKESIWL